ncbi:MAG TPA: efflux transporter outer membrane subunit [Bryobacteraceae bacterium]|nr:efflux transporter outer membrane subunit [Bryobacteraceae bacterium]
MKLRVERKTGWIEWARVAGPLAALLLLASCNLAPKYAKPPAPAPIAYKEVPPDYKEGNGWKLAQPGDDKLRGKWWELYNDPQLNALEEQVAGANQTIVAAEANYRVSRALVVSARAALFPTVGASPSYANSRASTTTRVTTVSGGTSSGAQTGTILNEYSLPFDVSYTVDFWHRIRNQIAANAYAAQASAADIGTAVLSAQAALADDYFQIRSLDMQRRILDDTVGSYSQTLQLTQILFKTGIDSDQDVAQAQTQLDTAVTQQTDLGVARATFEHAIATLIGKPPADFELPVATFHPNPPQVPVGVPSTLLERRPDVAAAERTVAEANANIGVARAAYYPNVTLSASAGFQTATLTKWFTWPSGFWSLGPQLSQTFFEGGARRALNEQAQAQYDVTVANYRQTVLTAFQAVEDNLASLRILSQEIVQEHTVVLSATHYLDLALTRYRTGVDSYLNVITAQTSVLTNREAEVGIELRQMTASVGLIQALGGGWDPNTLPDMKQLIQKEPTWSPAGPMPPNPPSVAPMNPPPINPTTPPAP